MILFLLPMTTLAQKDNDTISEIIIAAPKEKQIIDLRQGFTAGQSRLTFDTAILPFYRTLALSDLITDQSPVFVKSYGVNSLATMSVRGASAAQSEVLWYGVPLNNAALGLADISLLNGGLFSNIRLQYGGSSAMFGSGNVGGALLLADKLPDFSNRKAVSLTLGAGSFGQKSGLLSAELENKQWYIGFKGFYQTAQNDFSYRTNSGSNEALANAALYGIGGLLNIDYLFPKKGHATIKKQIISAKIWWQQYDREIPPALFEALSVKKQKDRSLRTLLSWRQERKKMVYYAKLSLNHGFMRYQDGLVLPNNENSVSQWYAEIGWQWLLSNSFKNQFWQQKMLVFTPMVYALADGENLEKTKKQLRPAIVAAYQLQSNNGRYNFNLALRREWWQGNHAAWLPGINLRLRAFSVISSEKYFSFSLLGNIQKSYRVPNINELYFSPGGNPDLNPERGWNESGGIEILLNLGRNSNTEGQYTWQVSNHSTLFNRHIKDWIYWLGGAIWTPHNLAKVYSRGLETETKLSWQHEHTKLFVALKTAYVLATTEASYLPNDGSIGKQIPYTPRYNAAVNFGLAWKKLLFNYNHHYTGYRFITTDESQYLKPYQVGNFQVSYVLPLGVYQCTFSGQCRNLWQQHYEVVNARPMPGRNFLISLTLALRR